MLSDGGVQDFPTIMAEDDGHIEQSKRRTGDDKHVDSGDTVDLIEQEGTPGRRRRSAPADHVLGDGRLTDRDAELEQFAMDSRCAPQRIGVAHLPNQVADLALH